MYFRGWLKVIVRSTPSKVIRFTSGPAPLIRELRLFDAMLKRRRLLGFRVSRCSSSCDSLIRSSMVIIPASRLTSSSNRNRSGRRAIGISISCCSRSAAKCNTSSSVKCYVVIEGVFIESCVAEKLYRSGERVEPISVRGSREVSLPPERKSARSGAIVCRGGSWLRSAMGGRRSTIGGRRSVMGGRRACG